MQAVSDENAEDPVVYMLMSHVHRVCISILHHYFSRCCDVISPWQPTGAFHMSVLMFSSYSQKREFSRCSTLRAYFSNVAVS